MLTFFSTARPFVGHSAVIQRNALCSWKLLHPDAEVILFGDEDGAAETALDLGLHYEPVVQRGGHGCKRLDYMFQRAQQIARHEILCYLNCDIVLTQDFRQALTHVRRVHEKFLMVGRRWDTDITTPLDFSARDWPAQLRGQAMEENRQRSAEWIDYFAFSRGAFREIPPLVIGRVFWDNWLLWKMRNAGVPVVDASPSVIAVHQNHDYGYHPQGKVGVWNAEESGENYRLAGGWRHLRTIADATEVVFPGRIASNWRRQGISAIKRNARQVGRFLKFRAWHPVWFSILDWTRPLRQHLGLRSASVRRSR